MSKVSKKKRKKNSSGSGTIIIVGMIAIIGALALIALSGGLTPPQPAPSTVGSGSAEELELCNGKPCPSKGEASAPVVMIELSDYACGHCRDFNLDKASILDEEYVKTGKVRYVSHVFALRSETQPATAAAMCANDQGKYWEFHHQAFVNQKAAGLPTTDDLLNWGKLAGVDAAGFADCVNSGRYMQDVQFSSVEGNRAGVSGTPTFFINGKMVIGNVPLDQFRSEIDAALAARQ